MFPTGRFILLMPTNTPLSRAKGYINYFFRSETGQDLIEYTLLLGFLVFATIAVLVSTGQVSKNIWSYNNDVLSQAKVTGSGGSITGSGTGSGSGNGNNGNAYGTGNGNGAGNGNAAGDGHGDGSPNGVGNGVGNANGNGNGNGKN
jgi:Flp pilus assembly pilin Flp